MKKGLVFKGICIGIACAAIFGAGRVYGETVISEEFRKEIEKTIDKVETEGPRAVQLISDLKAAGASYIPEILAPVVPEKYQEETRQRLIAGIYLMDTQYAIVFGKNKESLEYGLALYSLIDKLGFPVPELEKQFREALAHIDDPDAEERLNNLGKSIDQDTSWKEMLSSPKGMQLIVEGLYAWMLEGVYITSELAAQSNYNPAFLKVLNDHRSYLSTYMTLLDQFIDKPELASVLRTEERINTIKTLLALLSGPNPIGKDEVEEIRKVAGQARNQIVM